MKHNNMGVYLIIAQIISGLILFYAAFQKFSGDLNIITIFIVLGMEPFGRFLIAALELISVILLWSNKYSGNGAMLGGGVMTGAMIAHLTILGVNSFFYLGLFNLICCLFIFFIRRKEVFFIGKYL